MLIVITKEDFCKKVENVVARYKVSYMDAIIDLQEELGMDYSLVAKYLSKPLIEKLEIEGIDLNLIKKQRNALPFA
jgi:hypothetical protein